MALTREQILAADDLPREEVQVPEWGGSVWVRVLNAGDHARLGAEYETIPRSEIMVYLLARTLCDEAGAALFGPAAGDAVGALGAKNPEVLVRLFNVAARLNKMSPSDVDEAAKNSEPSPSAG
jgi:hypothetical protein